MRLTGRSLCFHLRGGGRTADWDSPEQDGRRVRRLRTGCLHQYRAALAKRGSRAHDVGTRGGTPHHHR